MIHIADTEEHDVDTYDQYVGTHVQLSIGDEIQTGKLTGHKHGHGFSVRGKAITNTILDTRTYTIEFPDGSCEECTSNVINESIFAQCEEEAHQFLMLQDIIFHKTDGHMVGSAYAHHCWKQYEGKGDNQGLEFVC
jgi:hypothetical protein